MGDEYELHSSYFASQLTILKNCAKFCLEWKNALVDLIELTGTLQVIKWQNPSIRKDHGEFVDDSFVLHRLGNLQARRSLNLKSNVKLQGFCRKRVTDPKKHVEVLGFYKRWICQAGSGDQCHSQLDAP